MKTPDKPSGPVESAGRQTERLWLLLVLIGVVAGLGWLLLDLALPQCRFRSLTGVPCPTCGATRCVLSLLAGDPARALAANPLVLAMLVLAAAYTVYAAGALLFRASPVRWRGLPPRWKRVVLLCGVFVVLLNWAYLIWRSRG